MTERMEKAVKCCLERQRQRHFHTNKYEILDCCRKLGERPARKTGSWPAAPEYSTLMRHFQTYKHIACYYDVDEKELRKTVKAIQRITN